MKPKLPPSCYVKSKKYGYVVFRPKVKSKPWLEHDAGGFLKPPIPLGKLSDGYEKIYKSYQIAKQVLEPNAAQVNTLHWIWARFKESRQFKQLAATTQKRYAVAEAVLSHDIKIQRKPATFGDLRPEQLKRPMVIRLMDKRLSMYKDKGRQGESMVNYEIRVLSSAITWALNYVDDIGVTVNPIINIPKFRENKEGRYVTDAEYMGQLKRAPGYLPAFMEVCYLCAARQIEIRHIKKSHVHGDKLLIERRKGSNDNYIKITPRLQAAIEWALRYGATSSGWLFNDANGAQISQEGVKSAMSRLKAKMKSEGMEKDYWSLHLLKHKGQTDSKDKGITGHASEEMKRLYDHEITEHDAVK